MSDQRVRVRMLRSIDSLKADRAYNLPESLAQKLIATGDAESVKAAVPKDNKMLVRASQPEAGSTENKTLASMTKAQIVEHAKTLGVELDSNKTKAELIAALEQK
ncbi:MAG TPA: hypothetical protein VN622_10960 [Clostridia bacterium]|nr:hypothetical protein [Clostridia bacterium]